VTREGKNDIALAALGVDRYANNQIEADHGRLKSRLHPMRGLKQTATPGS
jgi:transposase-like protein